MNQYTIILLSLLLLSLYRLFKKESGNTKYLLGKEKNQILALAHPLAEARIEGGFADQLHPHFSDKLIKSLRVPVLHSLGFKTDMTDPQIKSQLSLLLVNKWFSIGLEKLSPDDDPKAAIAFACARICFLVRVVYVMGWIEDDLQWKILKLNQYRAKDCFKSWLDYGEHLAIGRQQWVSAAKSDSLGVSFTRAQVQLWAQDKTHIWNRLSW